MNFPITTNCAKLLKFVIKYGKSPLVQVNEYNICYRNISAVNELIWNDEYWQVTLCKKRLFILWISFFRSCHHRCSIKNVFWKFAKFTGKRLCHSLFLKKLKAWGVANFYRTPPDDSFLMWTNPNKTVDLFTFTKEILKGKFHFLYSNCLVAAAVRKNYGKKEDVC